jgi:hypothetical protein
MPKENDGFLSVLPKRSEFRLCNSFVTIERKRDSAHLRGHLLEKRAVIDANKSKDFNEMLVGTELIDIAQREIQMTMTMTAPDPRPTTTCRDR